MSADNIIYFKEEADGQWVVWDDFASNEDPQPREHDDRYPTEQAAMKAAFALEDEIGYVEYGVSHLSSPKKADENPGSCSAGVPMHATRAGDENSTLPAKTRELEDAWAHKFANLVDLGGEMDFEEAYKQLQQILNEYGNLCVDAAELRHKVARSREVAVDCEDCSINKILAEGDE